MAFQTLADLWTINNVPAAAAQATASKAAAALIYHVAKRVIASLSTGATAQTPAVLNLRNGATGAGTVLLSWTVAAIANTCVLIDTGPQDLNLIGSVNTAMTIEFGAAGVAASQEAVSLIGFDLGTAAVALPGP